MRCHSCDFNLAAFKMNEEEHIISDQPTQRQYLHCEKVGTRKDRHVRADEVCPGCRTLSAPARKGYPGAGEYYPQFDRKGCNRGSPWHPQFGHSPSSEFSLAMRTTNSSVSGSILGSARISARFGTIKFACYQLPVPAHEWCRVSLHWPLPQGPYDRGDEQSQRV